ncbi:MAG TPA: phosphopantetheine-binding protein [Solirubrobacterales bacterium]|nr:phosphopantetheine-binding protein [Solirubrobacterales bacterium]
MPTQVTPESVEKTIFDGLVELGTDRAELSREATLEDLDVDSLDLVELAQIVEDEYGVELRGDDVKDVKTVGEVIDLVVSKAG